MIMIMIVIVVVVVVIVIIIIIVIIIDQMLTNLTNSFTGTLDRKFASYR